MGRPHRTADLFRRGRHPGGEIRNAPAPRYFRKAGKVRTAWGFPNGRFPSAYGSHKAVSVNHFPKLSLDGTREKKGPMHDVTWDRGGHFTSFPHLSMLRMGPFPPALVARHCDT